MFVECQIRISVCHRFILHMSPFHRIKSETILHVRASFWSAVVCGHVISILSHHNQSRRVNETECVKRHVARTHFASARRSLSLLIAIVNLYSHTPTDQNAEKRCSYCLMLKPYKCCPLDIRNCAMCVPVGLGTLHVRSF